MGLQSIGRGLGGMGGGASPQTDCLFNRQNLIAKMVDSSNLIKALVIKVEDARIVGDMKLMKRYYAGLFTLSTKIWWGSTPSDPTTTRSCEMRSRGGEPNDTASGTFKGKKCQNSCRDSVQKITTLKRNSKIPRI